MFSYCHLFRQVMIFSIFEPKSMKWRPWDIRLNYFRRMIKYGCVVYKIQDQFEKYKITKFLPQLELEHLQKKNKENNLMFSMQPGFIFFKKSNFKQLIPDKKKQLNASHRKYILFLCTAFFRTLVIMGLHNFFFCSS